MMQDKYTDKSLAELVHDLWAARLYIGAGVLIALVFAFGFLTVSIPKTRVSMMIAAGQRMEAPDVPTVLDGGINDSWSVLHFLSQSMNQVNSPEFSRFEHIYSGSLVASALFKDQRILDSVRGDRSLRVLAGRKIDSAAAMSDYIARFVRFEPVKSSSLRRLVYWHADPEFARYFLTRLHKVSDELIRNAAQKEADGRVKYLQIAIDSARHPDHKRSLTALLMEQERVLMMTQSPQAYAAKVVEPAAAFYRAERPARGLVFAFFIMVGSIFGFVTYGVRNGRG